MLDRNRCAAGIVEEVQSVGAILLHLHQQAAIVQIGVGICTISPGFAHAIGIVGKRPCSSAVGHTGKLSAVLPGVSPSAVGQRITNCVIGDRVAIVRGQQVAPIRVGIAVNNGIGGWWERFF